MQGLKQFTEAGLVQQLMQWREVVEGHLMAQASSYAGTKSTVEKMADDQMRLDQRLDGVEATASARIDDIVAKGIHTLQATIEEFSKQIANDRFAMQAIYDYNRQSLDLVVSQAAEKFKELDEFQNKAKGEMGQMVEGFNAEVERSRAADLILRGEIQELFRITKEKFDHFDGLLDQMTTWIGAQGRPGGGGGEAGAAGSAGPSGSSPGTDTVDPIQGTDPWQSFMRVARGAAALPGAAGSAVPPAAASGGPMPWPPAATRDQTVLPQEASRNQGGGGESRYRVENRNWGDNKKLDLLLTPEAYVTWRDRAMDHLAKERPDIRRLLAWAEKENKAITREDEARGAQKEGVFENIADVSYVLFGAIKHIIHDNLLCRARVCGDGNGLELWRKLHSEWEGAAPQVITAKAKRFQDPVKCTTVLQLWERLPYWEQLGAEITTGGYPLPDWLRANSLEKLVPDDMLKIIVGRPELSAYTPKMEWIRAQIEHAKSVERAREVDGRGAAGKGKKEDSMDVGNVNQEEEVPDMFLNNLQAEYIKRAAVGDWEGSEILANTIFQFSKGGKGKGKSQYGGKNGGKFGSKGGGYGGGGYGGGGYGGFGGKPSSGGKGFGKDGGKSGKGGKDSAKGGAFDGSCNHCGRYGHRKRDCRTLDAEMEQYRAGKGGMNNLDEGAQGEEGGKGDSQDDAGAEDCWWMGSAYNLIYEHVLTSNRYGPLEEDEVEQAAEELVEGIIVAGEAEKMEDEYRASCRRPPQRATQPLGTLTHPVGRAWAHGGVRRKKRTYRPLNFLKEDDRDRADDCLNILNQATTDLDKLMVEIEAIVDSGAVNSVTPNGLFHAEVKPSLMSKAGRRYRGPDGSPIPNLGQQDITFTTDDGQRCGLTMQVADVERPLIAVSHLSEGGNDVTLGKLGGKIVNLKTGKTTNIERKGNLYVLKMLLPAKHVKKKDTASVFPRPGRS